MVKQLQTLSNQPLHFLTGYKLPRVTYRLVFGCTHFFSNKAACSLLMNSSFLPASFCLFVLDLREQSLPKTTLSVQVRKLRAAVVAVAGSPVSPPFPWCHSFSLESSLSLRSLLNSPSSQEVSQAALSAEWAILRPADLVAYS